MAEDVVMVDDSATESSEGSDSYVPFNNAEKRDPQWQHDPAFHAYAVPGSVPPNIKSEDEKFLNEWGGWASIPVDLEDDLTQPRKLFYDPYYSAWTLNSYHPYWTKPGFDLRWQEVIHRWRGPVFRYLDDGRHLKA